MFSEVYHVIRSKADGSYIAAHPRTGEQPGPSYLLIFREHFEALSYLNTHGADVSDRFAVESVPGSQLINLVKRWGFTGLGLVQDPLIPRVEFLSYEQGLF